MTRRLTADQHSDKVCVYIGLFLIHQAHGDISLQCLVLCKALFHFQLRCLEKQGVTEKCAAEKVHVAFFHTIAAYVLLSGLPENSCRDWHFSSAEKANLCTSVNGPLLNFV